MNEKQKIINKLEHLAWESKQDKPSYVSIYTQIVDLQKLVFDQIQRANIKVKK